MPDDVKATDATALVTLDEFNALRRDLADGLAALADVARPLAARFAGINARLDALERRSAGVTIETQGAEISIPGALELAGAVRSIESTLRAPIVTEFDAKGRVKGARRAIEGAASASTIAALEARVAAIEARPTVRYEGTWKASTGYTPGAMVTDHGCTWIAKRATVTRPGSDPESWTLTAKGR